MALSPETVLQHMKQNGATNVVWLTDSWDKLAVTAEPSRLVGVTREGTRVPSPRVYMPADANR